MKITKKISVSCKNVVKKRVLSQRPLLSKLATAQSQTFRGFFAPETRGPHMTRKLVELEREKLAPPLLKVNKGNC